MTTKSLRTLAGLAAILVIGFLVLEYGTTDNSSSDALLPDLKPQINDITSLVVRSNSESVTVQMSDAGWVVVERGSYSANIAALRELFLAIADAKILEQKTSNPDKYYLIGVNDPSDEGSESIAVSINGDAIEHTVFLGHTAQSSYRYARLDGNAQSVLIDQNPDVPADAGGWLENKLVDVGAPRVQQVIISHADGEEVLIEKSSADAPNFDLAHIPEGRELSYPTVANGVGAALAELTLENVRPAPLQALVPITTTTVRTFDGLQIEVAEYPDGDAVWLSFVATALDSADVDVQDEVSQINKRVAEWQYTIPDHKASLLKRRSNDLLKAAD